MQIDKPIKIDNYAQRNKKKMKLFHDIQKKMNAMIAEAQKNDPANIVFESLFENSKILTIIDDTGNPWLKAKDVSTVLEYQDKDQSIRDHTEKCDRITFKQLKSCPSFSRASKIMGGKNHPIKITYQTMFINESGVNSLILGSKKPVAKKFKQWLTSEVIPSIRKFGKYTHKQHKPKQFVEDGIPVFSNKSILSNPEVKQYLELYIRNHKIDIPNYSEIQTLLIASDNISITDYDKKHVLYYFMTSITNANDNRMIVKLGYTADILERYSSLQKEYGCKFVLVAIKQINSQQDEKQFHKLIKMKHPELNYVIRLGEKCKDELYYFDPRITNMYESFTVAPAYVPKTQYDVEYMKYAAMKEQEHRLRVEAEIKLLELKMKLNQIS